MSFIVLKKEKAGSRSSLNQSPFSAGFSYRMGFTNGWEMQGLFTAALLLYGAATGDKGSLFSKFEPKKMILSGSFI